VDENGPAAKAGLKAGDVIVKFDGQPIADADDLRDRIRRAEGGKDVSITVQREGRAVDLKAKLAPPGSRARGGDST
jgi:S1-C subfamily serine protease